MELFLLNGTLPLVVPPQGDALRILCANLSSAVLAKVLSNLGPDFGNRIYVDDRYIWVRNIVGLRRALEHVRIYDVLCRSRLNHDETKVLAATPHLRKKAAAFLFDGVPSRWFVI